MKKRARNLTDADIGAVVSVLDGWAGPLTWSALVTELERRLGARYTRQALHKHARVQLAFKLRKGAPDESSQRRGGEIQLLLDRNARLTAENARLVKENDQLLEQFARWAYNAHTHGLAESDLDRPLPQIDRCK